MSANYDVGRYAFTVKNEAVVFQDIVGHMISATTTQLLF